MKRFLVTIRYVFSDRNSVTDELMTIEQLEGCLNADMITDIKLLEVGEVYQNKTLGSIPVPNVLVKRIEDSDRTWFRITSVTFNILLNNLELYQLHIDNRIIYMIEDREYMKEVKIKDGKEYWLNEAR